MNLPIFFLLCAWIVVLLIAHFLPIFIIQLSLRSVLAEIRTLVKRKRRQWHPRSPDDCQFCTNGVSVQIADLVEVTPWVSLKSRHGAPKRICSEGVPVKTNGAGILAAR
jgi:hypothetical protein